MAKGLVQNSSRKHALSYTRFAPNPLGVTTIAAINGRRGKGRRPAKGKTRRAKGRRERTDFGRLRLGFTTRSGERVSITPRSTSRRTQDLSERVARLSKKERELAKKVSERRRRARRASLPKGVRTYKSRAAYERARKLLESKRKKHKRKHLTPAQKRAASRKRLSRAAKTMEKAARRKTGHKKTARRKRRKTVLPMQAYYAAQRGKRIKGSPVIGIREEDVVVVPARRNAKKHTHTTKFHGRKRKYTPTAAEKAWYKWHNAFRKKHGHQPTYGDVRESSEGTRLAAAADRDAEARHSEWARASRARASKKGPAKRRVYRTRAGRHAAESGKRIAAAAARSHKSKAAALRAVRAKLRPLETAAAKKKLAALRRKAVSPMGSYRDRDRYHAAKDKVRALRAAKRLIEKRQFAKNGDDMRANKKRGAKKGSKGHRRSKARAGGTTLLKARIGNKTFRTYMVKGKKGRVVHIARYKLLGFKSEKSLQAALQKGGKRSEAISKRLTAIYKRRKAKAAAVMKHGDAFTPNRRSKVRYEEWSEMKPNRRKKGKSKKGRGMTKAKRRAAARKAAATRARKHAVRSRAAKKAARTRARRHGGHKGGHKHHKGHRRSKAKKGGHKKHRSRSAAGKARWRAMSAAKKAKVLRALAAGRKKAKRGGKRKYKKNGSSAMTLHANRGHKALANRKSYSANRRYKSNRKGSYSANAFMASIKEALGAGAIATGGFVAHRGLGWALSEKLLSSISIFQDASTSTTGTAGSLAPYRRIVAGVVVAAAGVPLAEKVAPKQATMLAAGMIVSLLHQVIVTALGQVAPTYAPALAGYGDRTGRAFRTFPGGIGRGPMGEYFLTGAGRSPFGEYFLTGQNGFGAYNRPVRRPHIAAAGFGASPITQAAAGYGGITQAAAGYGGITQAAAGYGAAPPMLSQAAAGVGEYFLTGANGIGDYEMVQPQGSAVPTATDEGIVGGDTHAAERALNIAEGVAGVTDDMGIGLQSIVDPTDVAVPVNDEPGGSRAGILAGSDGILG